MKTLIKNGRVVDPSQNLDAVMDVLIENGFVAAIDKNIEAAADEVYDASGLVVAAAGGVTTIACMPNTKPVVDNSIIVSGIKERAAREGYVNVEVIGAISKGEQGKELAELGDMAEKGAMAFSDYGHYLPGIPYISEDIAVARDCIISEYTGAHVHIAHVASKGALDIIRRAKARGVNVTCEVTVHHLTLTDEACSTYSTATRVSPPLRSMGHVEACRQALKDGTADAIVTDHAPHAPEEKDVEFRYAPNGFTGLETSLGVILTELYHTGLFTINEIIDKMSTAPAHIFALNAGSLKVGSPADVTVIDLNKEWTVDNTKFYTRGNVTPFNGKHCKGKAVATMVAGKFVMRDGVVCGK